MTTFHDAFLDVRRRIDDGADPDVVVPPLFDLAEAPDELEMAQALLREDEDDEDEQWL